MMGLSVASATDSGALGRSQDRKWQGWVSKTHPASLTWRGVWLSRNQYALRFLPAMPSLVSIAAGARPSTLELFFGTGAQTAK